MQLPWIVLLLAVRADCLIDGPWADKSLPPAQRARLLVQNMTLDEKLAMLHGPVSGPSAQCAHSPKCAYVGNVVGNARLQIPPITMNDGPQGFRDDLRPKTTTAWPAAINMAATWDEQAVYEWGSGMGKEFKAKGSNVQLGPALCVARVPWNGRNFEYLSGEDPYLGATLVKSAVKGIQDQKVVANAKHWVNNNQETNRMAVSEEVDERTRFEVYYPPFEAAIEADVGSFMCSYNKINGVYSCENPTTLGDLKDKLGFKGYVMSDWGATHSTSIMQGLDMEMPGGAFLNADKIQQGLKNGGINQSAVDDSVTRILWSMFQVGVMDVPASTWDWKKLENNVTTDASVASARKLAASSTVLLKNTDALLPLPSEKPIKIAVLGFADDNAVVHGGGSGSVVPSFISTPLQGLKDAAKSADLVYNIGEDLHEAEALASNADYAIVFVGTLSHEGGDRASLSLDDGCDVDSFGQCKGNNHNQNALVAAVAKANPKTIVVASVPGATLMPWSMDVAAILVNFLPGQQAGNAIADIIFGKATPSGKLPLTFPNVENETRMSPEQWPGVPNPKQPEHAYYTERLLVGYRFYDANSIQFTTGFPFGHGLSYTKFSYSDLAIQVIPNGVTVSFTVTNSGKASGAEVAQLYLSFPSSAGEPLQLKGFKKTKNLPPGEKEDLQLKLTDRDLSIWDVHAHSWSVVSGTFVVKVGSSSRDVRLQKAFQYSQLQSKEVTFVV
eukprot:TRINITY_DN49598_c0_g1_i1.p1 TRINITY_DN49598_c0_g1~~TRINITY_DN49598_c0_g1_i1.p1  ORF type:complete len:727 (-),score=142.39 TRINITY_DN49598_c0_g1_i1:78-2258(-)